MFSSPDCAFRCFEKALPNVRKLLILRRCAKGLATSGNQDLFACNLLG
jgi:hypothetical protein